MDVVRSWKNPHYRRSLGDTAPAHPSGAVPLDDAELAAVAGGTAGAIGKVSRRYCVPTTRRAYKWIKRQQNEQSAENGATPPVRRRPRGGGGGTVADKY